MKYIAYFLLLFIAVNGYALPLKLTKDIKMDSLTGKADAFIISQINTFIVSDYDDAELKVGLRLQVNNKKGEKYGRIVLYESEFVEIDDIEAKITDLDGKEIKELENDDITETSVSPGYILYQENKYKSFNLTHRTYPYILEINYTINYSSLFFWPNWYPQQEIPVRYSEYKLVREEPINFNTYTIGKKVIPHNFVNSGDSVSVWALENIPEEIDEDFMPPENKVQQALLFSPQKFIFGKFEGDFSSWDSFAEWYRKLVKNKYNLTKEVQKDIRDLVKGNDNTYEVITILYRYLQHNTRYAAIYLNIGGIEPHSSKTVCTNKYGDCKDLTIFMISMLKYAGIKAYPALVLTRDKGVVYPNFVASQFNHMVAFVPLKEDTLWLECTADNMDIYDRPWNIEDVNALVIKETSGEMIRTPKASFDDNIWLSTSLIEYQNPGMLFIKSQITTTGKQKDFFQSLFIYNKPENEKVALQKILGRHVPNLVIDDYSYSKEEKENTKYDVKISGVYRKVITHTGKRIFINPNMFNRKTKENLPDDNKRHFPIHFIYPYKDTDAIFMKIPDGYSLESAPSPISIETSFAYYKTEYSITDNRLKYIREFCYKNNDIPLENFQEFYDFLKTVIKNDAAHFIFKR